MCWRFAGLAGGLVLLCSVPLGAQDAVLDQMYGSGVHAYFSQEYLQAYNHLTSAVDAGSSDPRCYYFRGLCLLKLGREKEEAATEFEKAAQLEAKDVNRFYNVGRALERIQGRTRLMVEQYRVEARLAAKKRADEIRRQRYGELREAELRVLESQAAPPTKVTPPAPAPAPAPAPTPKATPPAPTPPEKPTPPAGIKENPFLTSPPAGAAGKPPAAPPPPAQATPPAPAPPPKATPPAPAPPEKPTPPAGIKENPFLTSPPAGAAGKAPAAPPSPAKATPPAPAPPPKATPPAPAPPPKATPPAPASPPNAAPPDAEKPPVDENP